MTATLEQALAFSELFRINLMYNISGSQSEHERRSNEDVIIA